MIHKRSIALPLLTFCLFSCKTKQEEQPRTKPAAIGFRQGLFLSDTILTLKQLSENSKKPGFVERYLGKHVTVTQLKPAPGGPMEGYDSFQRSCGITYRQEQGDHFFLTVWLNTKPVYSLLNKEQLVIAPPDTINPDGYFRIPFDACKPEIITRCADSTHPMTKEYSCPFDFNNLVVSGWISAIYPGENLIEMHLVPTGISD